MNLRRKKMDKKPILFNTEMVRAILEGRKTVTRQVIKPRYRDDEYGWTVCINSYTHLVDDVAYTDGEGACTRSMKPPYQVGDILYVRETWRPTVGKMHTMSRDGKRIVYTSDDHNGYEYKAHWLGVSDFYFPDGFKESEDYEHMSEITSKCKWHPSIHMPKEAARIFLRVTDVKVERLRDGFKEDKELIKEGMGNGDPCAELYKFSRLWDSTINKKDLDEYGWKANPWVWVIEFERMKKENG